MTKRKDAVALFDLISKGKNKVEGRTPGLNVPGWFRKTSAPAEGEPGQQEGETQDDASAPDAAPDAAFPPALPQAAPTAFGAIEPTEPMVAFTDGRVRISVNLVTCAVAVMGLVFALGMMFYLGRITGRTPAAGSGEVAGGSAAPRSGAGEANMAEVLAKWTKGKYYLIIDRMGGMTEKDKEDALAIAEYCRKNGHPCEAVILNGPKPVCAVQSLEPFESSTGPKNLEFARAIEDLGKRYQPSPGRTKYMFSQKRPDGKLAPSFLPPPQLTEGR
jgi:hypothetical protein